MGFLSLPDKWRDEDDVMPVHAYVVLVEEPGHSGHYGDIGFTYLGIFDGPTHTIARNRARRAHDLPAEAVLVVVATGYWHPHA